MEVVMENSVYATLAGRVLDVIKVYIFTRLIVVCMYLESVLILTIAAVCYPPCQNGGTCIIPGTCICQLGYDGHRCEYAQ